MNINPILKKIIEDEEEKLKNKNKLRDNIRKSKKEIDKAIKGLSFI